MHFLLKSSLRDYWSEGLPMVGRLPIINIHSGNNLVSPIQLHSDPIIHILKIPSNILLTASPHGKLNIFDPMLKKLYFQF